MKDKSNTLNNKEHTDKQRTMTLRATARIFVPGNTSHILQKSVRWVGISSIKVFNVEEDSFGPGHAFVKQRHISRIPKSNIRNAYPNEAVPFKININITDDDDGKSGGYIPKLVRQGPPNMYSTQNHTPIHKKQQQCNLPKSGELTIIALNALIKHMNDNGQPIHLDGMIPRCDPIRQSFCDN